MECAVAFSYRLRGYRVAVAWECFCKCRLCGLQVLTARTPAHENLLTCLWATITRRQHSLEAKSRAALRQTFSVYGEPLKVVRQFNYLGRVISYDDNGTPALRRNIKKARLTWGYLVPEGAQEGGGAAPRGRYVLPSGGSFCAALWQQKLGGSPISNAGTGGVPRGGRVAAHWHAPPEGQRGVGLPTLR